MFDADTIQSWTAEELIKETYHELNQKSSVALGWIQLLTMEENTYGFASEQQKDALLKLKKELEIIRMITEWMSTWQQGQMDK